MQLIKPGSNAFVFSIAMRHIHDLPREFTVDRDGVVTDGPIGDWEAIATVEGTEWEGVGYDVDPWKAIAWACDEWLMLRPLSWTIVYE